MPIRISPTVLGQKLNPRRTGAYATYDFPMYDCSPHDCSLFSSKIGDPQKQVISVNPQICGLNNLFDSAKVKLSRICDFRTQSLL